MKCKKCGAEIPAGYVYCSVCGNEVQLVPDYNLLDEDVLGSIIKGEAKTEGVSFGSRKKKRVNGFIWGGICVVLLSAVLTLFFVFREIQERHRNTYDYQYQMAEEHFLAGNFADAVLYYKQSLEFKPKDRKARERLLEIYLETEEDQAAVLVLQEFISENKKDKKSIQKLIDLYDKNKEYSKILSLCEEVKSVDTLEMFADYMVDQPKFSNISGTYSTPLTIELSSAKGYDIFYTTDGKDPVSDGTPYKEGIALEEGTTVIKAAARNEKGIYSEAVEAEYVIRYEPPKMPSVTPAGGVYAEPQMITIHVPSGCTAYYTWDGSEPTKGSFRYTGPLEMMPGNQVLSVALINSIGLKSSIYRVNYIYMP